MIRRHRKQALIEQPWDIPTHGGVGTWARRGSIEWETTIGVPGNNKNERKG